MLAVNKWRDDICFALYAIRISPEITAALELNTKFHFENF